MIKRFFSFLTSFIHAEDMPLRDRFLHVILLTLSIFLFTQCFAALLYISEDNVYATVISCFVMSSLYIYLYKTGNYNHTRILLFFFTCLLLALLWFSSEGVLGSIPYFIVFSIFMFVAISEPQHHKYIITLYMVFYVSLVAMEYIFPEWITPYDTENGQKIDITTSVFFVSLFIAFSFNFIIKRLEAQQKKAEEDTKEQKRLNEELDNFVYKTSHDLRAPILSALGLIELMENAKNMEEIKRYVSLQKESLAKTDNFITDIIQYSQNNRVPVKKTQIDFQAIFYECMENCEKKNYPIPVNCEIHLEQEFELVSDEMRLKVLFDNMLSNAHQFLDKNKDSHFLHIYVNNKGKDWEIVFEDNGIGIEANHIGHIFEMFYRANNRAKRSGIGLYIVKQAMAKLGGNISCTSVFGEGAKFVVSLPNQVSEKKKKATTNQSQKQVVVAEFH